MGGAGLLTHWMNHPKTEAEQNPCATRNSVRKYNVLLQESLRPVQTFSHSSLLQHTGSQKKSSVVLSLKSAI